MTYTLHTYELQDLVIALIYAGDRLQADTSVDVAALQAKLMDINSLCSAENGFTVTVSD